MPSLVIVPDGTSAPVLPAAVEEATAPPPSQSLTLYDLETHLQALADCIETVAPDQEQQFLGDFTQALVAVKEKRDQVAQFMAFVESQATLAIAEIARLRARQQSYERLLDRLKEYVGYVIKSLGKDEKGKWRKLEGNVVTFRLQKNPDSVEIVDVAQIPAKFKIASITLPLIIWEELLDALDMELSARVLGSIKPADLTVRTGDVKAALKANEAVPGAQWADTTFHLRRE